MTLSRLQLQRDYKQLFNKGKYGLFRRGLYSVLGFFGAGQLKNKLTINNILFQDQNEPFTNEEKAQLTRAVADRVNDIFSEPGSMEGPRKYTDSGTFEKPPILSNNFRFYSDLCLRVLEFDDHWRHHFLPQNYDKEGQPTNDQQQPIILPNYIKCFFDPKPNSDGYGGQNIIAELYRQADNYDPNKNNEQQEPTLTERITEQAYRAMALAGGLRQFFPQKELYSIAQDTVNELANHENQHFHDTVLIMLKNELLQKPGEPNSPLRRIYDKVLAPQIQNRAQNNMPTELANLHRLNIKDCWNAINNWLSLPQTSHKKLTNPKPSLHDLARCQAPDQAMALHMAAKYNDVDKGTLQEFDKHIADCSNEQLTSANSAIHSQNQNQNMSNQHKQEQITQNLKQLIKQSASLLPTNSFNLNGTRS